MRVTDSSTFDNIRRSVTGAREKMQVASDQASSGVRVGKPSDDPVAAAAARRETSRKALADAGKSSTDHATTLLNGTDAALDDVYQGLTTARNLIMENASTTVGPENRRAAAIEVRKIREQMVALGNTNVAGRFVFGGYKDQVPAYEQDGTFTGDTNTKEVQALPGVKVGASIAGTKVFGESGEDVFTALGALADALDSNDPDAIRSMLSDFTTHQDRVLDARSQVGSMMNNVTVASSVAERASYTSQVEINRLIAMDEVTAATNLVQAKGALDTALAIAQKIPTGGLAGG
jgi:flagellar hook-associated protein 3 FlgL